ncbi:MAG TPA: ABC transporter permease, partial [Acidimicrobiales bacterium]|nr:ABC transporter permease [Acidimicrobiales bacterium]
LGLGLFLSVFNVRYRDISYLVSIGMQLLFYATPLIYPLTSVPEQVKGIPVRRIIELNPLTRFVEWSRDAFYNLRWPSLTSVAGTTAAAVLVFLLGWMVFSAKTRDIAEEL